MKKYKLELTEKQLWTVAEALEFYSRFAAGQFVLPPSIESHFWDSAKKYGVNYAEEYKEFEASFQDFKRAILGLPWNASHGIGSPDLLEDAKVAYDIYRPIFELNAKEQEATHSVYYSEGLSYSKEGRVNVKTINEDE
jgi:hypothetical protein